MLNPVCVKCPDGQYRRAIFGFGPYISDYPEQCHLACIVQGWCPKLRTFSSSLSLLVFLSNYCFRCLTLPSDFDDPPNALTPRSMRHTAALVHNLELGDLWHGYGLVGDIVVCARHLQSFMIIIFSPPAIHRSFS